EIERTATSDSAAACFFSGYDCDSLAFEPVTGFVDHILPVFERLPNAWLELRTKSTQVRSLRLREALPNCVVAFSLSPEAIGEALEHKVPPLSKRLDVLTDLAARGWKIGLRFDPLIDCPDFHETYRELFESVFRRVPEESVHSVSLGPFRLPRDFYKTAVKQYPDEPLFAAAVEDHAGMVSYPRERERELVAFATEELAGFVPEERFFPCQLEETDSSDA
ncbi:MAG: spore photoproduct lyase family protein, partial [Planctomycetota bacterium]